MPNQSTTAPHPVVKSTYSDHSGREPSPAIDATRSVLKPATVTNLATAETQRSETALGDSVLRLLRIRKGDKKENFDLDAVCVLHTISIILRMSWGSMTKLTREKVATQPSIWDRENVEELKRLHIHPQWENWSAFDPSFRWSWREENAVRRKVDWKIMVCAKFRLQGAVTNRSRCGFASCLRR